MHFQLFEPLCSPWNYSEPSSLLEKFHFGLLVSTDLLSSNEASPQCTAHLVLFPATAISGVVILPLAQMIQQIPDFQFTHVPNRIRDVSDLTDNVVR